MDAVKYLKERARMTNNCEDCIGCPLGFSNNGYLIHCIRFENIHTEKAIAIVEKWGKEHPRKTYLSDLLEKHPNVPLNYTGEPKFLCPHELGYKSAPIKFSCSSDEECIKCWNTPIEE